MNIASLLSKLSFIPERKLLEFYPPFYFMGVKVVEVSDDYRKVHVKLPLKWYAKNMHGTMFGGWMCAVSDPLPALLCLRLFGKVQCWTKRNSVTFLRPARDTMDLVVEITDADVANIQKQLDEKNEASQRFRFCFTDRRGRIVARVYNTVFIRNREAIS